MGKPEDMLALPGGQPGVSVVPPGMIAESIKTQVNAAIASLPNDKTVAMIGVATVEGMNLALVARKEHERWGDVGVSAWIGKKWAGSIEGGVGVVWSK